MELKLEQVSVHSRDLACRYVVVKSGETLSYSIKPHRNSIYYGIYRKSGTPRGSTASAKGVTFEERLYQAQLEPVTERKKLVGGKVFEGSIDVEFEGMYALVFDNTFSKQKSKLVTFILQIYPTTSSAPSKPDALLDDEEAIPRVQEQSLTGILMKRRRKRLQGWGRRWFVLDFESNTLNYFLNEASTVLRGAIPLKVAVFSANDAELEINIDSGAEVWQLRAQSPGSFAMWKNALAEARDSEHEGRTHLAYNLPRSRQPLTLSQKTAAMNQQVVQENMWNRLRSVLAELNNIKELLHECTTADTSTTLESLEDCKRQRSSSKPKLLDTAGVESPRKNFWGKKRPSELPTLNASTRELLGNVKAENAETQSSVYGLDRRLGQALQTFENILKEQALLCAAPPGHPVDVLKDDKTPRSSSESTRTTDEVWSDALSGFEDTGFLVAHHDPEVDTAIELLDDEASSDGDSLSDQLLFAEPTTSRVSWIPASTKTPAVDLTPISTARLLAIRRRSTVPEIIDPPPSALKLMTSKVGSDVSSLSAPAATNEPLSLLQKVAEELEYSEILDEAYSASAEDGSRILRVAAFAVSSFSSVRHKERAKRKPFNPLLAETFELIREDKGFRFVAEKVSHRPLVGIASHADSTNWSFEQYQATVQKFYGKSMLLTTEGLTTVEFRTGDVYCWEKPEVYVKNITWGEKFIEPYGEMIIRNIVTGEVRTDDVFDIQLT